MIKKIVSCFLCVVLVIFLSGCFFIDNNSLGGYKNASFDMKMRICAFYSIPIPLSVDLKSSKYDIQIIDKDGFDRVLCKLSMKANGEESYLFVCQKTSRSHVFYYEDICYLFPGYTDEDVSKLKKVNDWEQPLDELKMTRREISLTFDGVINTKYIVNYIDVETLICQTFDIDSSNILSHSSVEYDNINNVMVIFVIKENEKERLFCARVNSDKDFKYSEFRTGKFEYDTYIELKRNSGWAYK